MTLFLLGVGFSIDATREAGPVYGNSIYVGRYKIDCGYPLLPDVLSLCFGLDKLPGGKSVEDLFSDALQTGDYGPMRKLIDRLMEADYRVAQKLALPESSNSYRKFFDKFDGAQFLTFNYDSLAEIFLSQNGRWQPQDGYGIPVLAELAVGATQATNVKSTSLVIHLHGSACVYTIESKIIGNPARGMAELVRRAEPLYAFDPDSISHCFPRYRRVMSPTGHVDLRERVIAPLPDKSEGLKQAFIRNSYAKGLAMVQESGSLVAIGYSFNPHDRVSYSPVLEALSQSNHRTLVIVSPQAGELAGRVSAEYSGLRVRPIEKTFAGWAADYFQGL